MYKYYYKVGYFKYSTEIPMFSHFGWDIRSWTTTSTNIEVSESTYNWLLTEEIRILKEIREKCGIELDGWHYPFKQKIETV